MRLSFKPNPSILVLIFFSIILFSCSDEDKVRMPADILGVWSPSDTVYLEFGDDNVVHHLLIEEQDGERIGEWTKDVYFYEPGYNLVIYLTSDHQAQVYEIIELTSERLIWCWVYDIDVAASDDISQVLGDIIIKAQEGFHLDPALYQTLRYIPQERFFSIIESLDINYPW